MPISGSFFSFTQFRSIKIEANNFGLKCLSLNVRGLRDNVKRKAIFMFCRRKNVDLILTHSVESDTKFWKSQCYFSHGTNHSAGVATLLIKPKGDMVESAIAEDDRWIILVHKMDCMYFIVCDVYGYNCFSIKTNVYTDMH